MRVPAGLAGVILIVANVDGICTVRNAERRAEDLLALIEKQQDAAFARISDESDDAPLVRGAVLVGLGFCATATESEVSHLASIRRPSPTTSLPE